MKKILPLLILLQASCSTTAPTRLPASQKNRQKSEKAYPFKIIKETHVICGVKFDQIHISTEAPITFNHQSFKMKSLPYTFSLPSDPELIGSKTANFTLDVVTDDVQIENPLMPNFPIMSIDSTPYQCQELLTYHQNFFGQIKKSGTRIGLFEIQGNNIFRLKDISQLERHIDSQRKYQQSQSKISSLTPNEQYQKTDSLFFFSELYRSDVQRLVDQYRAIGHNPEMISLDELPGVRDTDPVPADCAGEYFDECFYRPLSGALHDISEETVTTLKGYVGADRPSFVVQRMAFVPGLIRAYTRKRIRDGHQLKGITLIGSSNDIPGFYVFQETYQNIRYADMFKSTLHTDIFYMMPFVPLSPHNVQHYSKMHPDIITCKNGDKNRLSMWCNDDEWKYFPPERPLSALKSASYTPIARIFRVKNQPNLPLPSLNWSTLRPEEMVPVGRIPTHENILNKKDSIVSHYVEKIKKWHRHLPSLKNNSLASHGGSTGDTWIFLSEDISTFRSVYGKESKIYSSEFFTDLDKCQGFCEYKNSKNILSEMSGKHYTSMLINGHGAHRAIQAPFASNNGTGIDDNFTSDKYWHIDNSSARLVQITKENNSSFVEMENQTLIGHVMANSCDTANFNLDNNFHFLMTKNHPDAQQRSIAEQLIYTKNGGAMNVFMNSDVGWSTKDNLWNVSIMNNVLKAHETCKPIGFSYLNTIYTALKNRQLDFSWQVINRQYFGSPINLIAKKPFHCNQASQSIRMEGSQQ